MARRALIIYDRLPDPQDEAPARDAVESLGYVSRHVGLGEGPATVKSAVRRLGGRAGHGDRLLLVYHGGGTPREASEVQRRLVGNSDLLGGADVEPANRIAADCLYKWLVDDAAEGAQIVVVTDSCTDGSFFELRSVLDLSATPVVAPKSGVFSYAPADWGLTIRARTRPIHQTPAPDIVVVAPKTPGGICARVVEYLRWMREAGPGAADTSIVEVCKFASAARRAEVAVMCTGPSPLGGLLVKM